MATSPYTVRSSPNAGLGVFATRSISPGEVIMTSLPAITLVRGKNDVSPDQVIDAFKRLSAKDQGTFLSLHEGPVQYESKVMRIYKANAFSYEGFAMVFLEFSRVNHSCMYNAEMTETDNEDEGAKLVAVKKIGKGEEVFISYVGLLEDGSTAARRMFTEEAYGFTCLCPACELHGDEGWKSDMRRSLYAAMAFPRAGMEVSKSQWISNHHGTIEKQPGVIGQVRRKLQTPLTDQQKVRYGIYTAKLMEAEGFKSMQVAHAYLEAATSLHKQLAAMYPIVVIPAAKFVIEWMEASIAAMKEVRKTESKDLKGLMSVWDTSQNQSAILKVVKTFVSTFKSSLGIAIRYLWDAAVC
jgi:hypothetical protein